MGLQLDAAYRECQRLVRHQARNFYYGIRLLPGAKRQGLCAVYAFSRRADDAVDEHRGAEAWRRLREVRQLLDRAAGEGYGEDGDFVAVALGDALRRYRLSREAFADLLRAMAMDLQGRRYRTWEDLEEYCRLVAGSVGILSVQVFGYRDPRALELAVEMGVALQLTNIIRDVQEDLKLGRVYLPEAAMAEHGVTEASLGLPRATPELKALVAEAVRRARTHYARCAPLFDLLDPDARLCPMALRAIYAALLDEAEARGFDVLAERLSLSTRRKLEIVGALAWELRRAAASPA